MTKTERRLLLAIAMMLLNPDRPGVRDELEAAAKALLAEQRAIDALHALPFEPLYIHNQTEPRDG